MKKIFITIPLFLLATKCMPQGIIVGGLIKLEPGAHIFTNANVEVNQGTLTLEQGAKLSLSNNNNLSVNQGGKIYLHGDIENPATLTSHNGFFNINIASNATISAKYSILEKMGLSGLYIMSGATIDPNHPFTNCILQYGKPGGALLTIDNNQIITINGIIFNRVEEDQISNVVKNLNQGKVTFTNYGGNFAGEEFENDPHNLIHWIATMPVDRNVGNMIIEEGQDTCFDALRIITVAGDGNLFIVESGGRSDFIAREKISMLYGTWLKTGAYAHATITSNDTYCSHWYIKNLSLVPIVEQIPDELEVKLFRDQLLVKHYRIYPNPTSGWVNIEPTEGEHHQQLVVEIFNPMGKKLLHYEIPDNRPFLIDLSGYQQGLYLIRISESINVHVFKIIKK